jgi:hypothetical protein
MSITKGNPNKPYNVALPSSFPADPPYQPALDPLTGNFPSEQSSLKGWARLSAWSPGAIASKASATTTVTVAGAQVGDLVNLNASAPLTPSLSLTGFVSAANTVTLILVNNGAATSAAFTTDVVVEYWPANALDRELASRGY